LTVINVDLAVESSESLRAIASVSGDGIPANAAVLAGSADAIVDIDVALLSRESWRADALVAVDHISAEAAVEAWIRGALVDIHFAMNSSVSCVETKMMK